MSSQNKAPSTTEVKSYSSTAGTNKSVTPTVAGNSQTISASVNKNSTSSSNSDGFSKGKTVNEYINTLGISKFEDLMNGSEAEVSDRVKLLKQLLESEENDIKAISKSIDSTTFEIFTNLQNLKLLSNSHNLFKQLEPFIPRSTDLKDRVSKNQNNLRKAMSFENLIEFQRFYSGFSLFEKEEIEKYFISKFSQLKNRPINSEKAVLDKKSDFIKIQGEYVRGLQMIITRYNLDKDSFSMVNNSKGGRSIQTPSPGQPDIFDSYQIRITNQNENTFTDLRLPIVKSDSWSNTDQLAETEWLHPYHEADKKSQYYKTLAQGSKVGEIESVPNMGILFPIKMSDFQYLLSELNRDNPSIRNILIPSFKNEYITDVPLNLFGANYSIKQAVSNSLQQKAEELTAYNKFSQGLRTQEGIANPYKNLNIESAVKKFIDIVNGSNGWKGFSYRKEMMDAIQNPEEPINPANVGQWADAGLDGAPLNYKDPKMEKLVSLRKWIWALECSNARNTIMIDNNVEFECGILGRFTECSAPGGGTRARINDKKSIRYDKSEELGFSGCRSFVWGIFTKGDTMALGGGTPQISHQTGFTDFVINNETRPLQTGINPKSVCNPWSTRLICCNCVIEFIREVLGGEFKEEPYNVVENGVKKQKNKVILSIDENKLIENLKKWKEVSEWWEYVKADRLDHKGWPLRVLASALCNGIQPDNAASMETCEKQLNIAKENLYNKLLANCGGAGVVGAGAVGWALGAIDATADSLIPYMASIQGVPGAAGNINGVPWKSMDKMGVNRCVESIHQTKHGCPAGDISTQPNGESRRPMNPHYIDIGTHWAENRGISPELGGLHPDEKVIWDALQQLLPHLYKCAILLQNNNIEKIRKYDIDIRQLQSGDEVEKAKGIANKLRTNSDSKDVDYYSAEVYRPLLKEMYGKLNNNKDYNGRVVKYCCRTKSQVHTDGKYIGVTEHHYRLRKLLFSDLYRFSIRNILGSDKNEFWKTLINNKTTTASMLGIISNQPNINSFLSANGINQKFINSARDIKYSTENKENDYLKNPIEIIVKDKRKSELLKDVRGESDINAVVHYFFDDKDAYAPAYEGVEIIEDNNNNNNILYPYNPKRDTQDNEDQKDILNLLKTEYIQYGCYKPDDQYRNLMVDVDKNKVSCLCHNPISYSNLIEEFDWNPNNKYKPLPNGINDKIPDSELKFKVIFGSQNISKHSNLNKDGSEFSKPLPIKHLRLKNKLEKDAASFFEKKRLYQIAFEKFEEFINSGVYKKIASINEEKEKQINEKKQAEEKAQKEFQEKQKIKAQEQTQAQEKAQAQAQAQEKEQSQEKEQLQDKNIQEEKALDVNSYTQMTMQDIKQIQDKIKDLEEGKKKTEMIIKKIIDNSSKHADVNRFLQDNSREINTDKRKRIMELASSFETRLKEEKRKKKELESLLNAQNEELLLAKQDYKEKSKLQEEIRILKTQMKLKEISSKDKAESLTLRQKSIKETREKYKNKEYLREKELRKYKKKSEKYLPIYKEDKQKKKNRQKKKERSRRKNDRKKARSNRKA